MHGCAAALVAIGQVVSRGEAQREADAVMARFRWTIPREREEDGEEEFDTADLRELAVLDGVDVGRRIEVDDARETRSCISRAFAGRADAERSAFVIRRTSISRLLQVQIHQTIPIILLLSKGGPDAVHTSSSGYHNQSHHTIGKSFFTTTTTTTTTTTQTHYSANPT